MLVPYPSILASALSGMLVAASVVVALLYTPKLDTYRTLVLMLLFAIAIGVHGISHAVLEKQYGYVPFYFWFKST